MHAYALVIVYDNTGPRLIGWLGGTQDLWHAARGVYFRNQTFLEQNHASLDAICFAPAAFAVFPSSVSLVFSLLFLHRLLFYIHPSPLFVS